MRGPDHWLEAYHLARTAPWERQLNRYHLTYLCLFLMLHAMYGIFPTLTLRELEVDNTSCLSSWQTLEWILEQVISESYSLISSLQIPSSNMLLFEDIKAVCQVKIF